MTTKKGGGAEAPRTPPLPPGRVVRMWWASRSGERDPSHGPRTRDLFSRRVMTHHANGVTSRANDFKGMTFSYFFSHHSRCLYTYLGLFSFFNVFPISFRIMASFLSDISLNFNVLLFSVFRIMAGSYLKIRQFLYYFIISRFESWLAALLRRRTAEGATCFAVDFRRESITSNRVIR